MKLQPFFSWWLAILTAALVPSSVVVVQGARRTTQGPSSVPVIGSVSTITRAWLDDAGHLVIEGQGFEASPVVTLGSVPLRVLGASTSKILVVLSDEFAPGSYRLTVTTDRAHPCQATFEVTLGAAGPSGPPGPPGPPGGTEVFTWLPPRSPALLATLADGDVELSWSSAEGADEYLLMRSSVGAFGPFERVAAGRDLFSYRDPDLVADRVYHYLVWARNPGGRTPSNVVQTIPGPVERAYFQLTSLVLRDPHAFAELTVRLEGLGGCTETLCLGDVTEGIRLTGTLCGFPLPGIVELEGLNDWILDPPLLLSFPSLLGTIRPSGTLQLGAGQCTTSCSFDPSGAPFATAYTTDASGVCLEPRPETTSGYSPAIEVPAAPCFTTEAGSLVLPVLGGIELPLEHARVAGTLVGDSIAQGLILGFLPEAAAASIEIRIAIERDLVGGYRLVVDETKPLTSLLPGGQEGCVAGDDRDFGPDGATRGWWLYFNFSATRVQ